MVGIDAARAQSPSQATSHSKPIAIDKVHAKTNRVLDAKCDAFEAENWIPEKFTGYGQKLTLPLRWSGAPEGTRSYAIIIQDPDAPRKTPFVHWLLYDIPPDRTAIPMALPPDPTLQSLAGAKQGANSTGKTGYFAPQPPKGDPAHHYHIQVFALDRKLDLDPGVTLDELLHAMQDHVLADGQTIGLYRAP
jgi:Raf kinase inhibitor-like YbhB/YbcL family protein